MINEERTYDYYKNRVTESGKIYNALGRELPVRKNGTVSVTINGRKHVFTAGRIVYEAVTGVKMTDPDNTGNARTFVISFKDGNKANPSMDNLIVLSRAEYFEGHKWGTEKFSKEIKQAIVNDFKATGADHVSYRKLAKKYNCSTSFVRICLKKDREGGLS